MLSTAGPEQLNLRAQPDGESKRSRTNYNHRPYVFTYPWFAAKFCCVWRVRANGDKSFARERERDCKETFSEREELRRPSAVITSRRQLKPLACPSRIFGYRGEARLIADCDKIFEGWSRESLQARTRGWLTREIFSFRPSRNSFLPFFFFTSMHWEKGWVKQNPCLDILADRFSDATKKLSGNWISVDQKIVCLYPNRSFELIQWISQTCINSYYLKFLSSEALGSEFRVR